MVIKQQWSSSRATHSSFPLPVPPGWLFSLCLIYISLCCLLLSCDRSQSISVRQSDFLLVDIMTLVTASSSLTFTVTLFFTFPLRSCLMQPQSTTPAALHWPAPLEKLYDSVSCCSSPDSDDKSERTVETASNWDIFWWIMCIILNVNSRVLH